MPLGIDPKVDFAFKMVFGNPKHTNVTIHFLNATLQLREPIEWVEILNPIQNKDRSEGKLSILDVLARDRSGRHYNIEMQTTRPLDLAERLTYYNCVNYGRQIDAGSPYLDLQPAISICVLDSVMFPQVDPYHLSFRLRSDQLDLILTNDLLFHLLELPKFSPGSDTIGELPPLERWLYFLQHAEDLEANELSESLVEAEYREATEVLTMISRSPDDRRFYESRQKFLRDEQARLLQARKEGREEGLVAGKIQILQQLLGVPECSLAELTQLGEDTLASMLLELQQKMRSRNV